MKTHSRLRVSGEKRRKEKFTLAEDVIRTNVETNPMLKR